MDFFDTAYRGTPPWDIGRPQKEFVELMRREEITGSVLDIGCGTGEQVLIDSKEVTNGHAGSAAGAGFKGRLCTGTTPDQEKSDDQDFRENLWEERYQSCSLALDFAFTRTRQGNNRI